MHLKLHDAYVKAAPLINAVRVPSGDGFNAIKQLYGRMEMVQHDGVHATAAGTYMAACMFCAVLLGIDPLTLKTMESVNEKLAGFIRSIAHDIVFAQKEEA